MKILSILPNRIPNKNENNVIFQIIMSINLIIKEPIIFKLNFTENTKYSSCPKICLLM
jgi:hypothetical protein